jgi:succinate-acetate transporter protein
MLLIIAAILEFSLGNTFPTVVFFGTSPFPSPKHDIDGAIGYGAHFLTFGSTFQPFYAAVSSYTTDGSQQQTPAFASSFGFYVLFMGVLSFVFLICSLRTNIVFVLIFIAATLGFCLAAGAFWTTAQGMAIGAILLKGTGGAFFAAAMFGWYLLAVIMFATLDLPFLGQLPVGDLSTVVKGRSQMKEV